MKIRRFRRLFTAIAALALAAVPALAQIDPTVVVESKYNVDLGGIRKPDLPMAVEDTLRKFDVTFDYSIFNRPYQDLYDFTPFEALQLKPSDAARHPFLYLKLGCQYPLTPSALVSLQHVSRKGVYFNLYGDHNSFFGDVPSAVSDGMLALDRNRNNIGANFKYAWNVGELDFGASYSLDRDAYQFPSVSDPSATVNRRTFGRDALEVFLKLRSASSQSGSIYYAFDARYRNTASRSGLSTPVTSIDSLTENRLKFSGFVGATFDVHRVYVDMAIDYASYDDNKNYSIGIVEFAPIYELSRKAFHAKLGVRFSNRFGLNRAGDSEIADDGNDLTSASAIYPDVDARLELARDALWLHAVAGGGQDLNAWSSLASSSPFISPHAPLMMGSRPFDGSLSLESVISGRMSFNFVSSYTAYREKPIFVPVTSDSEPCRITARYLDVRRFSAGVDALWKSEDLSTGAEFRFNDYKYITPDYSKAPLADLPRYTLRTYIRYSWKERVIASVDFSYRSAVSGAVADGQCGEYSVPAICDLDVNLNYKVFRFLTVFVKGGNLLNMRNQYTPLYVEPGRNVGGGISITL